MYAAQVQQILDGDTLDLSIDLGFHTHHKARIRLAEIDAPELHSKRSRTARDFVFNRLGSAKTIVVQTKRTDIYGRYVAHLFYSHQAMTISECFAQGMHLNAELVEHEHAERLA